MRVIGYRYNKGNRLVTMRVIDHRSNKSNRL